MFTATINGANGLVRRRSSAIPLDVTGSVTWSGNTGCGTTQVTPTAGTGVATAVCTTSSLPGGTDTVTANYSGDSNHNSGSGSVSQVVNLSNQTLTVSVYPLATAAYGSSFTVVASASSGLPITYGSVSGSDCTNSGGTYTVGTKKGNCTVTLSQAGNNNYVAIPPITEPTTKVIEPVKPIVSFTIPAPETAAYLSTFTVTAQSQTANDTTLPAIAVVQPTTGSARCALVPGSTTNNGTAVSVSVQMTSGTGMCTLEASWALNNVYGAATAKTSAKATKLAPTVNFVGAPTSADYGSNFTVTATSNETVGAASVPTIKASGSCTVGAVSSTGSGSYQATVTMKTKGTAACTTTADWAASSDYAATSATQTTTPGSPAD
jgi:hypothetical protein